MPKFNLGKVLEGTAYGVLNEILAEFRSDDGYALPSRYEVVILPPQGSRGQPKGALNNIFAKVMEENTGEGTTRKVGLQCESISGKDSHTLHKLGQWVTTTTMLVDYKYIN